MEIFGDSVYTCYTRSARPVDCSRPHMSCSKSSFVLVVFTVLAGSQTSVKESTWDAVWPLNTSGLGRRMGSTLFSRYLRYSPPVAHRSLSFHIAVLPGNYRLEAPISPPCLAFVGSFCLRESLEFPYRLRLDAKRKRDGIHQGQSKGESFAAGEPIRRPSADSALTILNGIQLSEVAAGTSYLHDVGVIHGDLKGVLSSTRNPVFVSLTDRTGKYSR